MALVHVSARADYAVRAALELAAMAGEPLNAETIATRQRIPRPFLEKILHDLREGRIVLSRRGRDGGHRLARPAAEIAVADVLRAVEHPREGARYDGPARVSELWAVLRANVGTVLEDVMLADLLEEAIVADRRVLAIEDAAAVAVTASWSTG